MRINKYKNAVMWFFGFNVMQAKEFIRGAKDERLEAIKKAFEDNAKKGFYQD